MSLSAVETVRCGSCPIRHRAVCARCDTDELALLESMKSYRSFKAGEAIVWRGDSLGFVGSLVEGVAALSKTMEDGRMQMVGLLLPSDFIGRPGRDRIDFDVTALTDVTLCCFKRQPFETLVESTPHISQRLMELMLDELDAARDWMLLLGRKTAREKIATFIQMLVRRAQLPKFDGAAPPLSLPMNREQIASYLGLTLETVSRQLTQFKTEKIVRFVDRRQFEVLDYAALQDATGDDADGGLIA